MEALDMCILAEEISGEIPKRGEIMSTDGAFEIVIEKAESGDAEAKFTAGRYFIADHIDEENERAIRWIREAAEAGFEDAEEYMKNIVRCLNSSFLINRLTTLIKGKQLQ